MSEELHFQRPPNYTFQSSWEQNIDSYANVNSDELTEYKTYDNLITTIDNGSQEIQILFINLVCKKDCYQRIPYANMNILNIINASKLTLQQMIFTDCNRKSIVCTTAEKLFLSNLFDCLKTSNLFGTCHFTALMHNYNV